MITKIIDNWEVELTNDRGDTLTLKGEWYADFFKEYENKQLIIADLGRRLESSLGECSKGNEYEIVPYEGVFWINHKVVGSGEPLSQWVQSVLNGD